MIWQIVGDKLNDSAYFWQKRFWQTARQRFLLVLHQIVVNTYTTPLKIYLKKLVKTVFLKK